MHHPRATRFGWLAAALLLCLAAVLAAPLRAQDTAQEAPKPVTLTGCVSQTDSGQIQLTADSVLYALSTTAEDVDLSAHVGHTVAVTGTMGTPDPDAAEDAPKPFVVTSLKMVKDSCGS